MTATTVVQSKTTTITERGTTEARTASVQPVEITQSKVNVCQLRRTLYKAQETKQFHVWNRYVCACCPSSLLPCSCGLVRLYSHRILVVSSNLSSLVLYEVSHRYNLTYHNRSRNRTFSDLFSDSCILYKVRSGAIKCRFTGVALSECG